MNKQGVVRWDALEDQKPHGVLVENVDLVVVRFGEEVPVLHGRCLHRGALLADGHVDGDKLTQQLDDTPVGTELVIGARASKPLRLEIPLGEGSIENGWLHCPWHGWDFHPTTGNSPGGRRC